MARRYFDVSSDALELDPATAVPARPAPPRQVVGGRQALRALTHISRADTASYAIIGLTGLLFALASFLIWSWAGLGFAVLTVAALAAAAPLLPPETTMRLYRAEPMDLRHGLPFYRMADTLAGRAGLTATPKLYVIPSLTVNAFAAGRPTHAAIAMTEGLLRKLNTKETGAVLAHEMSHIRNDDLRLMARADVMTRVMQTMWIAAIALLLFKLPGYLTGQSRMPWLAIAILFLAPALGNMLQMALSRRREFDADLDAVRLTGDPQSVASALRKVERHQGGIIEDFLLPSRRVPVPSMLRTHPPTEARLARLERIEAMPQNAPLAVEDAPMVTMVGRGPSSLRPRYRLSGLWF
jgi:heat shock protein HtpX